MSQYQNRRDVRFAIRLPVQLNIGRRVAFGDTVDVSVGGVFVTADIFPNVRQLVQMQIVAPPGDFALAFHGMVVHVAERPNPQGHPAGLGVQFYAVDSETRTLWDRFIRYVERSCPLSTDPVPLAIPRETPNVLLRRFARHAAVIKVPANNMDELQRIYDEGLRAGRMFVPYSNMIPPGKTVFVHISHPTHPATFLLEAAVEQCRRLPLPAGATVKFLGLGRDRLQSFLDFMQSGMDVEPEVGDDAPTIDLGLKELFDGEPLEFDEEVIIDDPPRGGT
jgi:hypothetical protein